MRECELIPQYSSEHDSAVQNWINPGTVSEILVYARDFVYNNENGIVK